MVTFFSCLFAPLVMLIIISSPAFAAGSGAYRLEVSDAGATGKGSAFSGEANTPAAVYYNPAGLTQIVGQAVSVGASLVQPRASYTDDSGSESHMKPGNFGIPSFFYVYGAKQFALGIGATSSWGLTTEWYPDSFAKYYATKTMMQNKDYMITGAYKVNDQFSVALGLDIDDSTVDKQKKINQDPLGADANFRLKGSDTAFGYRIAGMYRLNERHQFGLMYRSQIRHKYEGKVYMDGLNTAGLGSPVYFNGTSYETKVVSKSTLPDSLVLGYSYKPDDKWTFNADLEWMNWKVIEEEKVYYPDLPDPLSPQRQVLDNGNPIPRDWRSALAFSLGTEYKMSDCFRLRGGFYHHQSPIPESTWTVELPDADSNAITTGFGYDFNKNLTLDMAWSGLFFKDRKIDNPYAPEGTYKQWISLTYATMTYKF